MALFLKSLKHIRYLSSLQRHITFTHNMRNFTIISCSYNVVSPIIGKAAAINSLDLHKRGNFPENISLNQMINVIENCMMKGDIIKKKDVTDIVKQFAFKEQLDSNQVTIIIQACGSKMVDCTAVERIQLVKTIWKNLLNVPLNVSHYNALLQVYLENDYEFSPIEFLIDMENKGILPDKVTFYKFIKYYSSIGDMDNTSKVLECLKERKYPITRHVFNTLILGYAKSGEIEHALNTINIMQNVGIIPTVDTYTSLMCVYAKLDDIASILNILKEQSINHMYFKNKHILTVLYYFIINSHTHRIKQMMSYLNKINEFPLNEMQFLGKLIDTGRENIAKDVLLYMIPFMKINSFNYHYFRALILNKMIHKKMLPEDVIDLCVSLKTLNGNSDAFRDVLKIASMENNMELALNVLSLWKKKGNTLRTHYFWPVFAIQARIKQTEGILNVLEYMINKCEVTPCIDTLKDYVFPYYYRKSNNEKLLNILRVPKSVIHNAILYNLVAANKLEHATEYMETNKDVYYASILNYKLVNAFCRTKDIPSFVEIARKLHNATKENELSLSEQIHKVLNSTRFNVSDTTIIKLINYLYMKDLYILREVADMLYNRLKQSYNDNELNKISKRLKHISDSDRFKEEQLLLNKARQILKHKNQPEKQQGTVEQVHKSLLQKFSLCTNSNAVQRVLQILANDSFEIPHELYNAVIICMYRDSKVKEAEQYINTMKSKFGTEGNDIILTSIKALVEANMLNYAKQLIKKHMRVMDASKNMRNTLITCLDIFDILAEKGNVKDTYEIVDLFMMQNCIKPSAHTLESLVKVHIVRNDLKKAVETYEKLCEIYKCTPYKDRLCIKLITIGDTSLFQRFIDSTRKVVNEETFLLTLLSGFNLCKRTQQTQKILQVLKTTSEKSTILIKLLSKHMRSNLPIDLSCFLDTLTIIPEFDRGVIYEYLLQYYKKSNDWRGGLDLWMKMQEKNILPSKQFTLQLEQLLILNNKTLPLNADNSKSTTIS